MPLNIMLEVKRFERWGIDFISPFPQSKSYLYILVCVDYVTKWVEVIACVANDTCIVTDFLKKNIFFRFGVPKVLSSDGGRIFATNIWKNYCKSTMLNTKYRHYFTLKLVGK